MKGTDNRSPAIDIKALKEIMDGDTALIQACFKAFLEDWPGVYVDIRDAVQKKDGQTLAALAHTLKGSLRYLAAGPAADAADALESEGKTENMDGLEDKLSTLKNECDRVIDHITKFKP